MAKKDREEDLKDVMAAEASRGRRRPQTVRSREEQRLLRSIARMILDRNCGLDDYVTVLRDDFGLQENSAEIQQYVSLWKKRRKF